jgi:hypothetical protein
MVRGQLYSCQEYQYIEIQPPGVAFSCFRRTEQNGDYSRGCTLDMQRDNGSERHTQAYSRGQTKVIAVTKCLTNVPGNDIYWFLGFSLQSVCRATVSEISWQILQWSLKRVS